MVVLIVLAAIAIYLVVVYNSLVHARNEVDNSWRQIDVQLKRRHDLIPNLVEAVKGYMQFERDTLTQVVEARGRAMAAPDQASQVAAENQLTAGLGRLLAVMENYPQLKSDQNVTATAGTTDDDRESNGVSRQAYNDAVLNYNNRIQSFPSNIIANNFGFKPAEYFKIDEPPDHAVPKVDLSLGAPRA